MRVALRSIRTTCTARICALVCMLCCAPVLCSTARAQSQDQLQFNSQSPLQLDTLIRYLSNRMEMKFIYSAEVGRRQVNLRSPKDVTPAVLFSLFSSSLRTANLAIVDAEVPGWKRIVDAKDLPLFASQRDPAEVLRTEGAGAPVSKSFKLTYINAQQVSTVIKPFLSKVGSNALALSDSNVLVVTDYAPAVQMVQRLVDLLDVPTRDVTYEFYTVRHMASKTLTAQAKSLIGGDGTGGRGPQTKQVDILDDPHGNRVVVVGGKELIRSTMQLLQRLDIPLGLRTKVYRVQNVATERLDKLIKGLLAPQETERTYQSTLDKDGNLLIVRATEAIHRKVAEIIQELDRPVQDGESPLQFYKLRNARATEVLQTLLALQEAYGLNTAGGFGNSGLGFQNPLLGTQNGFFPNTNTLPGRTNPLLGGLNNQNGQSGSGRVNLNGQRQSRFTQTPNGNTQNRGSSSLRDQSNATNPLALNQNLQLGGLGGNISAATLPGGARVSADVGTNSLIVVAPAGVQQMYANLIRSLDQRRPQVLIEARIVAVDTSDDFALGVEVSAGDRTGSNRLFQFTSFGLSEVDPTSGALAISPAIGFNGTLVDPDVADVVVQALAGNSRARVLSVPKVLVNDNSLGQLESVVSVPFQSVNASDTVSTTSLGGNQSAGTIISVTPHINEDDNLQLEFEVEFSTFSGVGTDGLPPPRQVDRVSSTVTIPDGQTVIVGGLKRDGEIDTFAGVPWIERIPVLRELTSRTTENVTTTSFFLFIRPLILRDSRFGDLRFVSNREKHRAGIPGEYPASGPVLMR